MIKIKNSHGFTLIELLVVIAIIGILAALIIANFGAVRERARDVQRKSDVNQIKTSLALYYSIWREYPGGSGDRIVGCGTAASPAACAWGGVWSRDNVVYMKLMPSDPLAPIQEYSYTGIGGNSFTVKAVLENKSDKDALKSQIRCGMGSGREYVVCQD